MANKRNNAANATLKPVPEIPAAVRNHINFVADKMVGRSNLGKSDRDDIVQELSIAAISALARCRRTESNPCGTRYLNRAVDNTSIDIFRYRISRNLDEPALSVEENAEATENGTPLFDMPAGDDAEQNIRRMDVREAVSRMPEDLRLICALFMAGNTLRAISEITGTPEPTIRLGRFAVIREFFVANGIDSAFF